MPINAVISMDKIPSKENRRVMQYLLNEVDTLRQIFNIRVDIIPRRVKGQPEASIQIGQKKAVFGYARIIPELKAATGRAAAIAGSEDPFMDYLTKNIGSAEDDERGGVNSSEKDIASAFTRATSEREKRKMLQKAPKSGNHKNGELPKISTPSTGSRPGARPASVTARNVDVTGDVPKNDAIFNKKFTAGVHEEEYAGDPSNSEITSLGKLPGMHKMDSDFWSNQFITSNI